MVSAESERGVGCMWRVCGVVNMVEREVCIQQSAGIGVGAI